MKSQRENLIRTHSGSPMDRRRFLQYGLASFVGVLASQGLPKTLAAHAAALPTSALPLDRAAILKTSYIARPARQASAAVVILHDWWGLNDEVKSLADQATEHGFIAIAPDLFAGRVATSVEEANAILGSLNADQILRQIDSVVRYTLQHETPTAQVTTIITSNFASRFAIALSQKALQIGAIVVLQGHTSPANQALNGPARIVAEQQLINAHIMPSPMTEMQLTQLKKPGHVRHMAPTLVSNRSFGYMAHSTTHKQFSNEWSRVAKWATQTF